MKVKTLNFERNFNYKLDCKYFTTIRRLEDIRDKGIVERDYVGILRYHICLFEARVLFIEPIDLENLTANQKMLLMFDYGGHWTKAVRYLRKLYGESPLCIIFLYH